MLYPNNFELDFSIGPIEEKGQKININLTSVVWPKSRTLLSLVSKMYNEKYINSEQRGILKEMIIDRNQVLTKYLNEYEISGDSLSLYQKIVKLSEENLNNSNKLIN
jgi:hypothetical protein